MPQDCRISWWAYSRFAGEPARRWGLWNSAALRYRHIPIRIGATLLCLALLLVGCSRSGVQNSSENDESTSTLRTTISMSVPVTNADGRIVGDPYAQCEITQSTAQPDPPDCIGDPDFEWERAPTYGGHEGTGWLSEGVLLSDPSEPYVTVGFELAERCGITRMVVRETEESVTVGLQYAALGPGVEIECESGEKKWALRRDLDAPLGERELVFRSSEQVWKENSSMTRQRRRPGSIPNDLSFSDRHLCARFSSSAHRTRP